MVLWRFVWKFKKLWRSRFLHKSFKENKAWTFRSLYGETLNVTLSVFNKNYFLNICHSNPPPILFLQIKTGLQTAGRRIPSFMNPLDYNLHCKNNSLYFPGFQCRELQTEYYHYYPRVCVWGKTTLMHTAEGSAFCRSVKGGKAVNWFSFYEGKVLRLHSPSIRLGKF